MMMSAVYKLRQKRKKKTLTFGHVLVFYMFNKDIAILDSSL